MTDKLRLGGMALANGVLVHGPTSWACAIRKEDGTIEVASRKKRQFASRVKNPFLRGPARLLEAMALLPQIKRALPDAKLPMQNGRVLGAMAGATLVVRGMRENTRLRPAAQELITGLLSLAPAIFALRGGELAHYHGAEHISIGRYEHGEGAKKEHERCGGHLVGPMLVTSSVWNVLAGLAPGRLRKPARAVAQALSKPGHELQHRLSTAEPTDAQLEVAEAALAACLALEHGADDQN